MHENLPSSKVVDRIEQASSVSSTALGSSVPSSQYQPASIRRRSLHVSHFDALQTAVSNLARIDDFDLEELGYGFFSDVFKATHKQSGKVMVLKRNRSTNTKMNILREVQLMNRLSHPNILKFKGVCVHEGQLHALLEYINGGDLDQLVTKQNVVLSWEQRIQLALDVAKGMNYLHAVGVFHRDLSSKNCLVRVTVDAKGEKKYSGIVADLGLAEKIPTCAKDQERLTIVGTPYIMAPEVLKGKPYNEKSDIFAFGLLVCQLIALVSVDPEEIPRSSDFGLSRDLFDKMVNKPSEEDSSRNTPLPPPNDFLQLAYHCCQLDPGSRPPFKEIVDHLQDILAAVECNPCGTKSACRACDTSEVLHPLPKESSAQQAMVEQETTASNAESSLQEEHFRFDSSEKKRRSSSGLSRSFSHISRELLSHFSNMIDSSSSNTDCDVTGKKDTFSNPFASLQYLEECQTKMYDKPSLALLEMTFDLTTFDGLKTSWNHQDNSSKKLRRPTSIYAVNRHFQDDHDSSIPPLLSPGHLTPIRSSSVCEVDHQSEAVFRESSNSSESSSQCEDCNFQRAQHRAMMLSPLGNNLASWWCRRQQDTPRPRTRRERHSLATVMSLLSKSNHSIPRSISLPDMSRKAILFDFPANELIEKSRTKRSKTSDSIFSHDRTRESITKETEDDVLTSTVHPSSEALTSLQSRLASDMKDKGSSCPACDSTTHACNNDTITELRFNYSSKPEASLNNSSQENKITENKDEKEDKDVTNGDDVKENGDLHASRLASCSSSSSSSGCSTSSLLMTVRTGEMTKRKRLNIHGKAPRSCACSTDKLNPNSSSVLCRHPDNVPDDAFVKSNNHDSGYEEDNLHPAASPSNEFRNHHVTWVIPEEPTTALPSFTSLLHKDHPTCGTKEQTPAE